MKVALVQDFLRAGGTERQTVAWATWLAAEGHEVTLITFRPGGDLELEHWPEGIHRISLQARDRHLDWYAPDLYERICEADPDCIVLMGRMANSYGWWLARSIRTISIVATVRTGKPLSPFYRWSLRAATGILANSSYAEKRVIREVGISADRITVVRNPVLVSTTNHPVEMMRSAIRQKAGCSDQTTVIVSSAAFRPEKNQSALVEMAAGLPADPEWRLWFLGTGKTEEKVKALARERGLENRVRFWGFQADPSPWLLASDIAVRASKTDSLSNFLIEAQWLGLATVTADVGGADECLVDGESGWITPPGDIDALREKVRALIIDSGLRSRARQAARSFAHKHFVPEAQFRKQTDYLKALTALD
jgi:glycosyltransferase involved in cell wall biosynthesis